MRSADKNGKAFIFPDIDDKDECVQHSQIVMVLDEPNMNHKLKYWFKNPIVVYK